MKNEFSGLKKRIDKISNDFYQKMNSSSKKNDDQVLKNCFDMNLDLKIEMEKTQSQFDKISQLEARKAQKIRNDLNNFLKFK